MVGMHNIICHWALYVEKLCGLERQIVAAEPKFNLELFWIYNNLSIRVTQCKRRTFPHIGKNSQMPLKIFPFSVRMKNLTAHIRPTWLWAARDIVSLSLPAFLRWGSSKLFSPRQRRWQRQRQRQRHSEGHWLFIPPGIFKVRLLQIVFAPAKCYTWH